MRPRSSSPARVARGAFTLAEVAVTIAVVGLALVWMLQALNTSKMTAAYTRNLRLARELGLMTLGQIESGLYEQDIEQDRLEGTYSDEGYPDFRFEAVFGDATFRPDENSAAFDNWRHEQDQRSDDAKKDEEAEQPYEKVQLKISFPPLQDLKSELVLERWLPWKQVHPPEEKDAKDDTSAAAGSSKKKKKSGGNQP